MSHSLIGFFAKNVNNLKIAKSIKNQRHARIVVQKQKNIKPKKIILINN